MTKKSKTDISYGLEHYTPDDGEEKSTEEEEEQETESRWSENFGGIQKLFDFSMPDFKEWFSGRSKKDLVMTTLDVLGHHIQKLQSKVLENSNDVENLEEKLEALTHVVKVNSREINHHSQQLSMIKRGWEPVGLCKKCQNSSRRAHMGIIWRKDDKQMCHRPKCSGQEVGNPRELNP